MATVDRRFERKTLRKLTSATIGDINIDYAVDISDMDVPFSMALSGCFFRTVQSFLGGNGVFFAGAAKDVGFARSYLLACVGMDATRPNTPDLAARMALDSLEQSGVVPIVSLYPGLGTGQVIILYQPDEQRFMIADRGANAGFTLSNLPKTADMQREPIDLLYVSGYCLLDDHQREAVNKLMRDFRDRGTFIVVDIVPHNIFCQISFDTLKDWTSLAHAVMAEAWTVFGFMGLDERVASKAEHKALILGQLLDAYDFCLVRLNSRSDFVMADKSKQTEVYIPYHARLASLRFTDRVLASAMFYYLNNNHAVPEDSEWVDKAIKLTSDRKQQRLV